jgi:hypothetical protein
MSQLFKTKRRADFEDSKRFGPFKGLLEQKKNVVFNSFVCKLGFFWHEWASLKREWNEFKNYCFSKNPEGHFFIESVLKFLKYTNNGKNN